MNTLLTLCLVLSAAPTEAKTPPPPPGQPTADAAPASSNAARVALAVSALGYGAVGVEFSHTISSRLGWDGMVSFVDMGYGHQGAAAELLPRLGAYGRRHALTVGVGPSFMIAKEYGFVVFGRAELAYEYRRPGGINLLVGFGPEIALNTSGRATCKETGFLACFLMKDQWHPGDVTVRPRVAFGFSF